MLQQNCASQGVQDLKSYGDIRRAEIGGTNQRVVTSSCADGATGQNLADKGAGLCCYWMGEGA